MAAEQDGDDDLWQAKLREAAEYFHEIKELWNDLIEDMPASDDYDEEEVANHYLGRKAASCRRRSRVCRTSRSSAVCSHEAEPA